MSPKKIVTTGWQGLVDILDEGSYTRYDFKTADKLLTAAAKLAKEYGGGLNKLHERSRDAVDLENRLRNLGKGIGNVTVSIFLRELRGIWQKANPKPTARIILAAKNLGITQEDDPQKAQRDLEAFWLKHKIPRKSFANFETALLRISRDYYRKRR